MTADAVRSYSPLPDRQPHRNGAAAIGVRLIRESYAQVAPRAEEATRFFYAMLFAIAPATRELFAATIANSGCSRSTTTRWGPLW
jgi:hypothetical protein